VALLGILLALAGCEAPPAAPELTECERFFLRSLDDGCEGVKKDPESCVALDCSQAALTFDRYCTDPDVCCAYRACWSDYGDCMDGCSDRSDFGDCADRLDECVAKELE